MADILDVSADAREANIAQAVEALQGGEAVVLPTDTVYGVGADAFNLDGTARVFAAKDRQRKVPLPVLVRSPKQLLGLTPEVPEVAEALMAAFWPGALTLVVPAEPGIRWDIGRTEGTVAVRMPLDDVALDVIRQVGPMAVTSANLHGEPPATTAQQAHDQLGDAVACYLDDGPRTDAAPSTIVDLTRAEPHVLREGAISEDLVVQVARGELDPLEASAMLFDNDEANNTAETDHGDDIANNEA